MVHFLRNEKNRTIIECDVYSDDLRASTSIPEYTAYLLGLGAEDALDFMSDIAQLDEIRGWWWERASEFEKWYSIDSFDEEKFSEIANKWDLSYVVD